MPELLRHEARDRLLIFLEERFGIMPDSFEPYQIYAFKRQAFLFRRQPGIMRFPKNSFVRCGLPFMRLVAGYLKPTTVFLQRFGHLASKNILLLDKNQLSRLCLNTEIDLGPEEIQAHGLNAPGYIIIKMDEYLLGAGLLVEERRLLCRFPKAMRQALAHISGQ